MADSFAPFDLGRVIQTAEAIKALRRQGSMDKLQEQYLGQRIQAGEQEMQRAARADAVVLGKEKAQTIDVKASQILQAPTPKNYVEQYEPDLVKNAAANGVDWQTLDDAGVRQWVTSMQNRARQELGVAPQQPERFTLKPGETRYVGDKPVVAQPAKSAADSGFTLAPGQTRYDANGNPIASVAPGSDKEADNTKFSRADKLRDEYNTASKEFVGVGDAYSRIIASAADPSAAGDLALIFSYMKILDPGSVVREQEFANAQNAAGVPDQIRAQYNKVLNGERLAAPQRADFIERASRIYKGQSQRHEKTVKTRYSKLANEWGVDPKYVVSDLGVDEPAPPQPQEPETTATGPNGQKIVLRNGQWVPLGQ